MGEINARVFTLLDEKNLKAADLSRTLEVSEGVISAWRKRGTDPKAIYMNKIADFLGVSRTYLEEGKKDTAKISQDIFTEVDLSFSEDEKELINLYRSATEKGRNMALGILISNQNEIDEAKKGA